MKNTHLVIDEIYHENEPLHIAFVGSRKECDTFLEQQQGIGMKVVPITKEELIKYNQEDKSCVCQMRDTKGEPVHRILGKGLAKQWKQKILFTGTHSECLDYMVKNNLK